MRKGGAVVLTLAVALSGAHLVACASATPVQRAEQLVRMHREGEALTTLEKHLAKHPDDVPARRLLVRVRAFTGDLDGARREVDELARRMPDDPVPWIELGHAFELAHQFDEALAAYDTAASTSPASAAGPREGGMRAARWGEPEEAVRRLEEAVRRGAKDAETFHVLGLARLNLRDLEGAKTAYQSGLAANPESTENILGLATVAIAAGDAAGALAAYDALLRKKPRYAAAELGRAWALAKLGRKPEAEQALDHAAELGAAREHVDKQRRALRAGTL